MKVVELLKTNKNYRNTWFGQIVSEVGDHFNSVAVFSLAVNHEQSGLAVAGVLISRAVPMLFMGPLAGVSLDRFDRKKLMIGSDLVRFIIALLFIPVSQSGELWALFLLSALLMAASPFFTSGRSAILPTIASKEELHTANAVTQTTAWSTVALGAFLGGTSAGAYGYDVAFFWNAASFLISAGFIARLKGDFRAPKAISSHGTARPKPWHDYVGGLKYLRANPLLLGICLISVGWATGGGAAQILFSLFGEKVYNRGPAGIGEIWGAAGIGLVCGGIFANWLGPKLSFNNYKRTISIAYLIHGGSYVAFSLMPHYPSALLLIGVSRAAVAISSVLNLSTMMRNVDNEFRGRVFATMETLTWSTMMISMMAAGIASTHTDPRTIGVVAGVLSSTTAIFWGWANWTGRLPEPVTNQKLENTEQISHGTR